MTADEINESFRRWNAVPLSDLRGQHLKFLNFLNASFEKQQPPWRRTMTRSNNRMIYRIRKIKAIRGIHVRTLESK